MRGYQSMKNDAITTQLECRGSITTNMATGFSHPAIHIMP